MFPTTLQKDLKKNRKYGRIQESDRREKKVSLLETRYRHEWKHAINYTDLLVIRQRLRAVAQPDEHARDGQYLIRSLYFDNAHDKALREKIDGVNMREKFRIRYYNGDTTLIHLEKKSRRNGLGTKYSAVLSAEEVRKILDGEIDWMRGCDRPLVQELYCKMRSQGLRPKTIVDYTREPYVFRPGNVRVTFDSCVSSSRDTSSFFADDILKRPVLPAGMQLLEVKFDEFLPDEIYRALQLDNLQQTAFSKYYLSRKYTV
ncbi:MAG: polyphosphate polymerase domain-containing protein, partial [Lachnospiraceae bacterium]|nr:polyphosphate polymerase domain-containing protein [Lachnospiraceae bacterium]